MKLIALLMLCIIFIVVSGATLSFLFFLAVYAGKDKDKKEQGELWEE